MNTACPGVGGGGLLEADHAYRRPVDGLAFNMADVILTGLPLIPTALTVIRVNDTPSAATIVGLAMTVDFTGSTAGAACEIDEIAMEFRTKTKKASRPIVIRLAFNERLLT